MKLSRLLLITLSLLTFSISFTACEEEGDLTPNPVFDPDFNPDSAKTSSSIVIKDVQYAFIS